MKLLAGLLATTLIATPVVADEYNDLLDSLHEQAQELSNFSVTLSGGISKALGSSGRAQIGGGIFKETIKIDAGRKVSKLLDTCGSWTDEKNTCTFVGEAEVIVSRGDLFVGKDSIVIEYIVTDVTEFTVNGEKVIGVDPQ